MCIRDYLIATRGVNPVELERRRMHLMRTGYDSGGKTIPEALAYVSVQELATRVSHRNTARHVDDPAGRRLLSRVATDENLHMIFYRTLVAAALEIDPSAMVPAICRENPLTSPRTGPLSLMPGTPAGRRSFVGGLLVLVRRLGHGLRCRDGALRTLLGGAARGGRRAGG